MSAKRKRRQVRRRADGDQADVPAVLPQLRFRGDHYKLMVGDKTWAEEITACMAATNRFADALTLGVMIVRDVSSSK